MKKYLFFVCPTDNLESIIDLKFKHENYYLSSLGNSMTFNEEIVNEIDMLIKRVKITEIIFVLASNNRIIDDALKDQEFSNIKVLRPLYKKITLQKKLLKALWKPSNIILPIISSHLNEKINELRLKIKNLSIVEQNMRTQVFDIQKNVFSDIHDVLFYREHIMLN